MPLRLLATVTALLLGLAACTGGGTESASEPSGPPPDPAPAGMVTFVGLANLQWAQTEKAATLVDGALEVTITCEGAVPHNVVLEGVADDDVLAECSGDDRDTGTVDVEPGTYTYYCAIPGHRTAGMEGTISIS